MTDQKIILAIQSAVGGLGTQVQGALGQISKDITELARYVSAETLRRQVLEEVLFENADKIGLSKESFEKKFEEAVAGYQAEQEKKLEELRKAAMEAREKEAAKPKIYKPGEF